MLKRKGAVATIIMLFLCVAIYLNWSHTAVPIDTPANAGSESNLVVTDGEEAADETEEYFKEARLEKEKARESAITTLKESVEEENLSQESRDSAAASIETLAGGGMSEARIETLIKAKGYKDCIALINTAGVNVIVTAPESGLTPSDTTKIKDIVVSETSVSPSKIKIIEIK